MASQAEWLAIKQNQKLKKICVVIKGLGYLNCRKFRRWVIVEEGF